METKSKNKLNVVTGAFGYSGKYIARLLMEKGERIRTLTNKPAPAGSGGIEVVPYHLEDEAALRRDLLGADTLYNTYWVRFNYGDRSYGQAVANTKRLINAAAAAGVRRFVHVSITNPSEDSPLPYFKGKAELERTLAESGLSYAILRPTVLFGKEDILINNISWLLRRLPVFGVFSGGEYGIQPVFVEDLARLAVEQGERVENVVMDAVGPEIYSFDELVKLIRKEIGSRSLIMKVPPAFALAVGRLLGRIVGDVVITDDEIKGLMAGLLVSSKPPSCPTQFSGWLRENSALLGRAYANEVGRHFKSSGA